MNEEFYDKNERFILEILNNNCQNKTELINFLRQILPPEIFPVFEGIINGDIPAQTNKEINKAVDMMIDNVLDSYNSGKINKEKMSELLNILINLKLEG